MRVPKISIKLIAEYLEEMGLRILRWRRAKLLQSIFINRAACVVTETMAGHRPSIWVSDLYGAQQGHADLWQVCLAHQLRDCKYAIEAGDTIFAPRMKALLLRAVVPGTAAQAPS